MTYVTFRNHIYTYNWFMFCCPFVRIKRDSRAAFMTYIAFEVYRLMNEYFENHETIKVEIVIKRMKDF